MWKENNAMGEDRPLTAEERRRQISEEKERIRKRFKGVDQSLLDCIPAAERASFFDDTSEKRVCAYCRVSTDDVNQTSSIELQQHIYEQMIAEHPGWQLVRIYVDEGISGTSTAHREAFQEMLRDCEAGLIDVIMAKSVSRFARNTVDCISIIRKLKFARHPVGVYFETERFYTLDANSELMLNMMAMLAQSESQTKSDVMNGSIEHRFRMGIFLTPPLLGYDKDGEGDLVINEDEANTIRLMYYMTLAGSPTSAVADTLMELKRRTKLGNTKWTASGVTAIMRNERYCGEVLARKTITPNFLDHKAKKNNRNRNQYRMTDHHEPIVTREQWRAVQKILDSRRYRLKGGYVPLRVIESGALQGFVSLNRAWAGTSADDYYTASREAYGKNLPDYLRWYDEPPADDDAGEDDADATEPEEPESASPPKAGFQVVSMSLFSRAQEPALIVTEESFRFKKTCIDKMGSVTHVEMLLNPLEHLIVIRPCAPDHPNAIPFRAVAYNAKSLTGLLFTLMGWEQGYRYYMPAIIRTKGQDRIMFFDLDLPSVYERRQKGTQPVLDMGSDGSVPVFGKLLAEHVTETRVPNIDHKGQWDVKKEGRTVEDLSAILPDAIDGLPAAFYQTDQ
jgi:site-specific DNA recombinase